PHCLARGAGVQARTDRMPRSLRLPRCSNLATLPVKNVTASATIAPILHGNEAVSRAVCPQGLGRDGQDWEQEGHAYAVARGRGRRAVWPSSGTFSETVSARISGWIRK